MVRIREPDLLQHSEKEISFSVEICHAVDHSYDHTFPLRSKAPKGMKPSTSNAASQNLLECV